jgi:hypothetical protein
MRITSKNVFIVNTDRETFENFLVRKKNTEIINHHDINQKLINNDSSKSTPNPEIIEFYILKKINIFKSSKKLEFLFFLVEDLSKDFIINIKSLLSDTSTQIYYHLLTPNNQDEDIKSFFDSIQCLENDKNRDTR